MSAPYMSVPSFDDDDDGGGGDDDGARGAVWARAPPSSSTRGDDGGGGDDGDDDGGGGGGARAALRGAVDGTKTKVNTKHAARERAPAARTDAGVDGKAVSGKTLGRRRRAAEKRRRAAEKRRGGDTDATKGVKIERETVRAVTASAARARVNVDPGEESSDYDEELLPEAPATAFTRAGDSASEEDTAPPVASKRSKSVPSSSSFMDKMRAKLSGGQFRMLNEQLYTTTGDEGLALVSGSPELFEAYHAGFRAQVESWPTKPVHVIANLLKKSPKTWVVADFGCGDAELARSIAQKCHSFDLQTPEDAPEVVACNMSDVPLNDDTIDCAVFSLSLMGTDYGSFLEEAHRVLKPGGLLWIAEVRSRFDGQNGTASVASFVAALGKLGFKPKRDPDESNAMFFTAEFIKTWVAKKSKGAEAGVAWPPLKACAYKRR